jgi:hypothetical protein
MKRNKVTPSKCKNQRNLGFIQFLKNVLTNVWFLNHQTSDGIVWKNGALKVHCSGGFSKYP